MDEEILDWLESCNELPIKMFEVSNKLMTILDCLEEDDENE